MAVAARAPVPAPSSEGALSVEVTDLFRRFDGTLALQGVSLAIRDGEFFSLLGPSGCGKTTLLRILAGLERPDTGVVRIAGRDVRDLPAHRRPVNTVFQSYALFPHLTVRHNVAFGLRMKRVPAAEIEARVRRVLDLVRIAPLADRKPAQLSGGQKQRVAVARALVNEPQVLLLDEPLSALDLQLRRELRVELRTLQRRLGITFVFVTHDQDEALALSDRIAVMCAGRIEQVATAEGLYERPRTRFVAEFLGSCNLLETAVCQPRNGEWLVHSPLGELRIRPAPTAATPASAGIALAIRPERVRLLAPASGDAENCVPARVEQRMYSGAETQYLLRAGDQMIKACALNARAGDPGFRAGQEVIVHLPADALIVLER
ncbi:MAG: ABC transporter ATP-binding protein [Verrucomicrobia bacterium]|nr:ABC transporter ATP-binding protein [Verrucomicrobiota bacterium]